MIDGSQLALHGALAGAGIAAGFLNVMAGGGSMLTLPVLMLLGLPADVANGTNRLSIVTQSVSGVWAFRRAGKLAATHVLPVALPTIVGAAGGALVASRVPPALLEWVLLGTMMLVAAVMTIRPGAVGGAEDGEPLLRERRVVGTLGLLLAGVYGGFVQAGVGFVLLSVLGGVLRFDLVRANALKLVCTMTFGTVALGIFVAADQVAWLPAGLLAVYTVIGAQLGVRFALRVPQRVLRWVVFCAVIATCIGALVAD